jgi:hypothetical protein
MGRVVLGAGLLLLVSCGDDPNTLASSRTRSASSSSGDSAEDSSEVVSSSGGSANQLCFDTINGFRKSAGLAPYVRWSSAESCSDGEAKSDGTTNRAHGAFPSCGEMAQNECPATPGQPNSALPLCLRAMINAGPGEPHHDTMLSTQYTKVACGVFATPGGATWSVQNFR